MSPNHALRTARGATLAGLLALSVALPPITPRTGLSAEAAKPHCVINFIGHETTAEKTRVILHANTAIDYRGGSLHGNQVVLDIANVQTSLPSPVVELGAPEVARVVIGPEISRDGEHLLKVRLVGVRAASQKVETKGNELYVDLTPVKGARDSGKGMPKLINNSSEIMASVKGSGQSVIKWARAVPVTAGDEPAPETTQTPADNAAAEVAPAQAAAGPSPAPAAPKSRAKLVAIAAGEPIVTSLPDPETAQGTREEAAAAAPATAAPATAGGPETAAVPATQAAPGTPASAGSTMTTTASTTPAAMTAPAMAAAPAATTALPLAAAVEPSGEGRVLKVAVGRSLTLETGVPVARVSISNPAVAEPVAISPTQLLINGLTPGVVSLVLWPKQGPPIVHELVVQIDTTALSREIESLFPNEKVRVGASKDSIILSGSVTDAAVGDKLVKLAGDYSSKVVNDMTSPGPKRKQIMLKVKFAEVSKQAMTELATMWTHVDPQHPWGADRGNVGTGQFVPPFGNLINKPPGPDVSWSDAINLSYFDKRIDLGLFITALKERGLFQELAEPTLIAASGQEANFLAGGEFPVPIAQPGANFVAITVVWKKFGIMLDFKPTITGDDVIVMNVKPEVSSLDFSNGVLIQGFRIPSLIVRRAETEVELKDGQSFAIAGLYDRNLLQTKQKIPILGDIPLLGYLFRSKALERKQAELLVIVTPTIVQPLGVGEKLPELQMPERLEIDKPGAK